MSCSCCRFRSTIRLSKYPWQMQTCYFFLFHLGELFPNLVVKNLVVCNLYAEALFCALLRTWVCALLRSFADLCLRSFALICGLVFALCCALLRSFACFCVRPHLERPRLGLQIHGINCPCSEISMRVTDILLSTQGYPIVWFAKFVKVTNPNDKCHPDFAQTPSFCPIVCLTQLS